MSVDVCVCIKCYRVTWALLLVHLMFCRRYAISTGQAGALRTLESSKLSY